MALNALIPGSPPAPSINRVHCIAWGYTVSEQLFLLQAASPDIAQWEHSHACIHVYSVRTAQAACFYPCFLFTNRHRSTDVSHNNANRIGSVLSAPRLQKITNLGCAEHNCASMLGGVISYKAGIFWRMQEGGCVMWELQSEGVKTKLTFIFS